MDRLNIPHLFIKENKVVHKDNSSTCMTFVNISTGKKKNRFLTTDYIFDYGEDKLLISKIYKNILRKTTLGGDFICCLLFQRDEDGHSLLNIPNVFLLVKIL